MSTRYKVELIPANQNVIFLRTEDNRLERFPRNSARHVRIGDVVIKYQTGPTTRLKVVTVRGEDITDVDIPPVVPPSPIETPEN